MSTACPFCNVSSERIWLSTENAMAFTDSFPITEGHTLVVPFRHITSIFNLPETDRAALWALVEKVRAALRQKFQVDAFNVGVNDGVDAGQTIGHAHIHVIPRRKGDVPDPRGGIRWVIPNKADYWNKSK